MKDGGISPEAYFDVLAILGRAPQSVLPASVIELHLYAYLGCILALFRGTPVGDWGYRFAVTSDGFPFSVEFENARRVVLRKGYAREEEAGLLSPEREALDNELATLLTFTPSWRDRQNWLTTATACTLALPVGSIRYAINQSPGMSASLDLGQRRTLLESGDIERLYEEYKLIENVLEGDQGDLLSPAVIWLSARVLTESEVFVGA